jgi:phage-related protein
MGDILQERLISLHQKAFKKYHQAYRVGKWSFFVFFALIVIKNVLGLIFPQRFLKFDLCGFWFSNYRGKQRKIKDTTKQHPCTTMDDKRNKTK